MRLHKRDRVLAAAGPELWSSFAVHLRPVFEKTCGATQKNVKSHVFLDFEKKRKKRKKVPVGLLYL